MHRIDRSLFAFLLVAAVVSCTIATPCGWGAKKPSKAVTTVDGRPIRRVYVRSASADTANAAATQVALDTCLSTVPAEKDADAVLDLGMALPAVDGGAPTPPNVFSPTPHAQTLGNAKTDTQTSASATCSDGKSGGCTSSYNLPAGDLAAQPGGGWTGNPGNKLDVSLASPGETSEELWQPNDRSKKSWSDQLRVAAGCPVCAGGHFDRRKYKTYRNWIETVCPAMLAASK